MLTQFIVNIFVGERCFETKVPFFMNEVFGDCQQTGSGHHYENSFLIIESTKQIVSWLSAIDQRD